MIGYKRLWFSIMLSAFTEGLLSSHHLAMFFMYSDFFQTSSETYQLFETIINFKFILIPLMGFLLDHFKIFGYSQRSYLILNGLIGCVCYLILAHASLLHTNLYICFIIHLMIDISNIWRKIINDSLCIILNNYLKTRVQDDKFKDHSRQSMDTVYGTKYLGNVISWIFFLIVYNHVLNYYFYFLAGVCILSIFTALFITQENYEKEKIDFHKDI